MTRISFLVVALTTFSLGCALTWLDTSKRQSLNSASFSETRMEKKALLDGIEPTFRACGNGYSQGYELPGGKKIGEGNDCYSSFRQAHKEMTVWLLKADKIIETVPPRSKAARSSERIIASFPKDELGNEWVRIMWVHGSCIHWISAPNLEFALEFEKSQLNPYKFEDYTEPPSNKPL